MDVWQKFGEIKEKGTKSNTDDTIWGSQALLQNGTLAFAGNTVITKITNKTLNNLVTIFNTLPENSF